MSHEPSQGSCNVNELIQSLEDTYGLGLKPRDKTWTPIQRSNSVEERCVDGIKLLYFKAQENLDHAIKEFKDTVKASDPTAEKLAHFAGLLNLKVERTKHSLRLQSESPRSDALGSMSRCAGRTRLSHHSGFLLDQLKNAGDSALILGDKEGMAMQELTQCSDTGSLYGTARTSFPRTPTDEESNGEDDEILLQSPTVQAQMVSKPTRFPLQATPQTSPGGYGRGKIKRRASEGKYSEGENSPKYSRTLQGRQITESSSCSGTTVTVPSANTSFASSIVSFDRSGHESDITPATSFNSSIPQHRELPDHTESTSHANHSQKVCAKLFESSENQKVLGIAFDTVLTQNSFNNPQTSSNLALTSSDTCLEHYHVRDLPKQGLFCNNTSSILNKASLIIRWEASRIALENDIQPDQFPANDKVVHSDHETFWKHIRECGTFLRLPEPSPRSAWKTSSDLHKAHSLKAELKFNPKISGPLFKINLQPLRPDKSCRFQRAFGADRFFYLTMPINQKLPAHLSGQDGHFKARIQQWLSETHCVLGRKWQVLFHEHEKSKKKKRPTTLQPSATLRVVLFATSGCDILSKADFELVELVKGYHSQRPEIELQEIYDWFMSFEMNKTMAFCKAYARLSLGLSRTTPTLVFEPSQVKFVRDILSDGSSESQKFNDPTLTFTYPHNPKMVMNDGCALISVGAAMKIWESLHQPESLPSVFQGRIGGAKGTWMLSGPTTSQKREDHEVWIEISDSQKKFCAAANDLDDATYDKHRLTFDLLRFSTFPSKSKLHSSFLPILCDRGVQEDHVLSLAREGLDHEEKQLLNVLHNKKSLHRWAYEESSGSSSGWNAGLPLGLSARIIFLLQSGFTPKDSPYLAELVFRLVCRHMMYVMKNLNIPLEKSTVVLGVADPLGVLKPGEVHLRFSKRFRDDITNEWYSCLDNVSVVVARHPALRRSDIQKVQAIPKPELDHLVDVIVFPSKGQFPLAGKLQGGDYDGDTFWVCWQRRLTEGFRNAPAPVEPVDPKRYRIHVDERTVEDITRMRNGEVDILRYQRQAATVHFQADILGLCTNLHEKLCYNEGSVYSSKINDCADLHDLLVDSSKNGYMFSSDDYRKFIERDLGIWTPLPEPAHKAEAKRVLEGSDNKFPEQLSAIAERTYKKNSINDRLFFEVLVPHISHTLELCRKSLSDSSEMHDPILSDLYQREKKTEDPDLQAEFRSLERRLDRVYETWTSKFHKDDFEYPKTYTDTLTLCYGRYSSFRPQKPEHPRWRQPIVNDSPSDWDLIKASALYCRPSTKAKFVFGVAGKELAWIKSHSVAGGRSVIEDMWATLRPKKDKKPLQLDDAVISESEPESAREDIGDTSDSVDDSA